MNPGSGHPGDERHALTPEERALADRLARLGPQGEPSPALDARVLAAARADATATPAPRRSAHAARTRRRWPVAFGAAATLAIVGGLAWQLRPLDEVHVEYSEAPRTVSGPSADTAPAAPAARVARRAPDRAEASGQAAAVAPPAAQPLSAPPPEPAAAAAAATDQQPAPKAFKPAPAEPPVVFDEPSPMDTPAPPPEARRALPPPPTPPAPPAPVREVAPLPAPAASREAAAGEAPETARLLRQKAIDTRTRAVVPQVATGTRASTAKPADPAVAADASELDSVVVTGARSDSFGDQPAADLPPASADSPQVQQAWLQRVRQLVAEGKPDAARASLREYRHRYPEATLPEDLRALLAE